MQTRDQAFLGTEPVGRLLMRLAIPTVIAQLVNMLYNIVDRIYIGHIAGIGSLALTGVGVCMPIIMIVTAFAALVASGSAPRASIAMGRGDRDTAEKLLGGSFSLQIAISLTLTAVLLIWAAFQVWANMFGTLGAVKLRTAHIMFLLPLAFTLYPTFKKERRRRRFMPVWDIALIAAAILSYGYLFLRYDAVARTGRLNATDVWVGVVCLLVAFEAARRASGNLAVIALVFLSYFAVWGQYIPGTFGTSAFTLKRVIKALVWDTNGILGTGAGVSATYIFVFVLFGAFLKYSVFSQFINDIALTLVGQTPGGPAKVAVIASALMGMINGSAIANVATTGTITIPLMKKTGYKKDFAAAVEAVASTGGQFTPPIMGAVGFVMAEFMCVSYTKVMLAAAIPAFLYYLSLLYSVHLEAKRSEENTSELQSLV